MVTQKIFPLTWALLIDLSLCSFMQAEQNSNAVPFSELPVARQHEILRRVAPPVLTERKNPYSTPMYYLFAKGYQDGVGSHVGTGPLELERNRPDWQEELIKNWVELGLTSTHFLTWPTQWEDPHFRQALRDFLDLSKKYGLRVGFRLGGDESFGALEGSGWNLHPDNPENRLQDYIEWTREVVGFGRGQVDYYVLGDELNAGAWEAPDGGSGETIYFKADPDKLWTPDVYMKVFVPLSEAIKEVDPDAKVSMFGMGGLDTKYIKGLIDEGYLKYADGVGTNHFDNVLYRDIESFTQEVRQLAPKIRFYSNGVGYLATSDTDHYPSNFRGNLYSDQQQAALIAKVMFRCFLSGWESTPYYIAVRRWVLPDGSTAPHWYGLFGFMDLVVDEHENLTVRRWPGWYAFQTISHIFYDRNSTDIASFDVSLSEPVDFVKVLVRNDYECLLVLWNHDDENSKSVDITLPTQKYSYPVQVSLLNYRKLVDLPYSRMGSEQLILNDVKITAEPTIIRLVAED